MHPAWTALLLGLVFAPARTRLPGEIGSAARKRPARPPAACTTCGSGPTSPAVRIRAVDSGVGAAGPRPGSGTLRPLVAGGSAAVDPDVSAVRSTEASSLFCLSYLHGRFRAARSPAVLRLPGSMLAGGGESAGSPSTEAVEKPVEECVISVNAMRQRGRVQRFAPSRCVAAGPNVNARREFLFATLNDSAPLTVNETFGSQWQVPENILPARFVRFGARFR